MTGDGRMRGMAAGWSGALVAGLMLTACAETGARPTGAALAARVAPAPAPSCADLNFPIYFQIASDQLTSEARQVIADSAARVRGCRLGAVDVIGLADARSTARRALALSERRAVVVADTMKAAGLPAPNFQLEARGKEGARGRRGVLGFNHRVDVTIHVAGAG